MVSPFLPVWQGTGGARRLPGIQPEHPVGMIQVRTCAPAANMLDGCGDVNLEADSA